MRTIGLIALGLLAAACEKPAHYAHTSGVNDHQHFHQAWYVCQRSNTSSRVYYINGVLGEYDYTNTALMNSCLAAYGWRKISG